MAWLEGWSYRKSITLSRASGAVTNYTMKLLVGESSGASGESVDCGGLCLSTFNDLRFTTSDGTTLLDYWIESITGTTPNQLATVWIEFDSIGTGATTFYMYYGNASASSASNGTNTFILFDDFASLDAGKWTISAGTPTATTDGSLTVLEVTSNDANSDILVSANAYGIGTAVRAKVKTDHYANTNYLEYMCYINTSNYGIYNLFCHSSGTICGYVSIANTSHHTTSFGANWSAGAYYVIDSFAYAAQHNKVVVNDVTITDDTTNNTGTGDRKIYIQTANSGAKVRIDWLCLRQVLETDPAWGTWGEQESSGWTHKIGGITPGKVIGILRSAVVKIMGV